MTWVEIALAALFLMTMSASFGYCVWDYCRIGKARRPIRRPLFQQRRGRYSGDSKSGVD